MEKIPGELTDHPHHRGLWFAHQSVNGYDYWNNEFEYEKDPKYKGRIGHIFVTKIKTAKGGANSGEIAFSAEWKQLDGVVVLTEDRKMTFYSGTGENRIIDFDIVLTARETCHLRRRKGWRVRYQARFRTGRTRREISRSTGAHRPDDQCTRVQEGSRMLG